MDGGPELEVDLPPTNGPLGTFVTLPEGRQQFEYWGEWTNGEEAGHNFRTALVDKTDPQVEVDNPNPFKVFVIKRRVRVNVDASDSLSGLTVDPSGSPRLATSSRGSKQFTPAAVDLCENQAVSPFDYSVLAPGLGVRAVVERVKGRVRIDSEAAASQNGDAFTAFRVPREVPVGTLVDTREGTVRLTSSRNRRTSIQDGQFKGGCSRSVSRARPARRASPNCV